MNVSLMSVVNKWKKEEGLHICYLFNRKKYIESVVSYIISGIRNEEMVVLVENDRNILHIKNEIDKQLSDAQLVHFHYINNYDFYWSTGDFHTQTILHYFSQIINPLLETRKPIRTWAHVEWGDEKEVNDKIEDYEKIAHTLIKEKEILSVCAYDISKAPSHWQPILANCHSEMIIEDD